VIFKDNLNAILLQAVGIIGIVGIHFEVISIIPGYTLTSAEPHVSLGILEYASNSVIGQSIYE
jgi:hypothetical protein